MPAMAQAKRTLYEIVGVAPDAPAEEIARACDAKRAQLDAEGSADASTIALVRHAREVLTDPSRRAAYDARLAPVPAAAEPPVEPELQTEAEPGRQERRTPWGLVAVIGAAALIVLLFAARMMTNPVPPAPVAEAPRPAAPAPPPAPPTASQVLVAATPSIVKLQAIDLSGTVQALGLGVSTESGMAATPCHDIPANAQIVATGATDKGAGTLVITDETLDLCKLSIAGLELKPLALSSAEPRPGTKVYVVSPDAPGGFALAEASITQLLQGANAGAFQLSAAAANGAPVLDESGRLLGIASQGRVLPAAWIAQAKTRAR